MLKRTLIPLLAVALSGLCQQAFAQFGSPPVASTAAPYVERAQRAAAAGNGPEELAALESGVAALGATNPDAEVLLFYLQQFHADRGNMVSALRATEQQLALPSLRPVSRLIRLSSQGRLKSTLRDRKGAEEAIQRMRTTPWPPNPELQVRLLAQMLAAFNTGFMEAQFGDFEKAETGFSSCLSMLPRFHPQQPYNGVLDVAVFDCTAGLATAMIQQGKLAEAGAVLGSQKAALDKAALDRPSLKLRLYIASVRLAMEQGRLEEARSLAQAAVSGLQSDGAEDGSRRVSRLMLQLAQIEMLQGRWKEAVALHQQRRDAGLKLRNAETAANLRSVDFVYALIRSGRAQEAEQMSVEMVANRQENFGPDSVFLWEARVFHGLALAANGKTAQAQAELAQSVPRLMQISRAERSSAETGLLRNARLNWALEGYINLLSDVAKAGGSDAPAAIQESFRLADLARGSTVQRALGAAATRSTPSDPALSQLSRQEQDQRNEMSSLTDALTDLLARGRIKEQDQVVADMRKRLAKLRTDHASTMRDLERRFPAYSGLLEPKPLEPGQIQKLLKPDEAMLAFYSSADRTLVWAVSATGPVSFAAVNLGAEDSERLVSRLRRSLDPSQGGNIPRFDTTGAHELYQKLLQPVSAGWQNARKLIIVPHGAMARVPFGVLLTAPYNESASGLPFSSLAQAPWLINKVALSQLPAAMALPSLRGGAQRKAGKSFVGFGDPVFSGDGTAASGSARSALTPQRRNLAVKPSGQAAVVESDITSAVDFSLLAPLPDTTLEIREVGQALNADLGRDAYLGERASETNIRKADLSDYRVVMFATHGLVPGELPGLYQPALALSNPALTREPNSPGVDGLLTMEEILSLRLNADWVVLSACNTAAPNGRGTEAVSGLGRAFFYAGAKSLLVTNWPVETVSARLLTTETFRRQAEQPQLSRADALREASLALMKKGTPAYSYAHPMFWAPYVIVGDGS